MSHSSANPWIYVNLSMRLKPNSNTVLKILSSDKWINGRVPLSVHQLGQWMPGRSREHPAARVYSLECCPTSETPARTFQVYSTATCSPTSDQELAEPGTVDCKHHQQTSSYFTNKNLASQDTLCNHVYNVTYKLKTWTVGRLKLCQQITQPLGVVCYLHGLYIISVSDSMVTNLNNRYMCYWRLGNDLTWTINK